MIWPKLLTQQRLSIQNRPHLLAQDPQQKILSISDYYPPCASCLRLLKYLYQQAPWYILVPLPYSPWHPYSGGFYAGLAGAIGSGIFDLIMGHSQYTLFSIVIKGLAGVIVGVLTVGWRPSIPARSISTPRILLAMLVGAIWTAAGYFVAWWVVLDSYIAAVTRLPASFPN